MKNRIISAVLVVSMLCTMLVVPAKAFDLITSYKTLSEVVSILGTLRTAWGYGSDIVDWFTKDYPNVTDSYAASAKIKSGNAYLFDVAELNLYSYDLNQALTEEKINLYSHVAPIADTGYLGIRVMASGHTNKKETPLVNKFLVADDGLPIVAVDEDFQPADEIMSSALYPADPVYYMLERSTLYNRAQTYMEEHPDIRLQEVLVDGVYEWRRLTPDERVFHVLCTADGLPLGAYSNESVLTTERPVEDTEIPLPSGMDAVMNLGAAYLDGSLFDSLNNEFYFDFNIPIEINNNYYYNYTYEYYIDYTSVTYIGSSAEYTETYDFYYTLPDGRSSADLTKEELEQLNVTVDVIPYGRSTDDTRLRSLYHFDGDTVDDSYWNYMTEFEWISGASITYLESNAFNGCLYLDENEHSFRIELPSLINKGDFTLDFRYYSSATMTPAADSYIMVGDTKIAEFTGAAINFNGLPYVLSSGVWNHVAFDLSGSTLRLYINGLLCGQMDSYSGSPSQYISFYFGSDQQTFKYFDELRVLNAALYSGDNFTPSAVPYDTNLALVLPDDAGNIDPGEQAPASRLPNGYTELEYIESTGTQYIDTEFYANQNSSVSVKFSTTQQSGGGVVAAMQGWRNRGFGVFVNALLFGSSSTDATGLFGDGQIHEVKLNSEAKCYDNGRLIWTGTVSTFTTPTTLTICKSNVVSEVHEYSSAKIYACQIYDNGTLVRDFVPCVVTSSGEAGLYCLATDSFYGNVSGSGAFVAGPVVETSSDSGIADEYVSVEYTGTQLLKSGDFRSGTDPGIVSNVSSVSNGSWYDTFYYTFDFSQSLLIDPLTTSLSYENGYVSVSNVSGSNGSLGAQSGSCPGLYVPLAYSFFNGGLSNNKYGLTDLTCTVVFSDGSSASLSTSLSSQSAYPEGYHINCTSASESFSWGTFGIGNTFDCKNVAVYDNGNSSAANCYLIAFYILPSAGQSVDISYIVLETGTKSTVEAEFVSGVFDEEELVLNAPVLAVRTDVEISRYQIGGVRPSVPEKGLVWALVEGGYITSLQIYNGFAWVECDGRIWTGVRWIPFNSFNVITLNDMYDVSGTTSDQYNGFEYIYTQQGFWTWFQKQWITFTTWCYTTLIDAIGAAGSGSGGAAALPEDVDDKLDVEVNPEEDWTFDSSDHTVISVIGTVVEGTWSICVGFLEGFGDVLVNVPKAVNVFVDHGSSGNSSGALRILMAS